MQRTILNQDEKAKEKAKDGRKTLGKEFAKEVKEFAGKERRLRGLELEVEDRYQGRRRQVARHY